MRNMDRPASEMTKREAAATRFVEVMLSSGSLERAGLAAAKANPEKAAHKVESHCTVLVSTAIYLADSLFESLELLDEEMNASP